MKELLRFWSFITNNCDEETVEELLENYEFDADTFSEKKLSVLSDEEIDSLFGDLIGLYMDASGTDNLGDVYEVLVTEVNMSEERASKLLS